MNVDATIQRAIAQLEAQRNQIDHKIAALRSVLKPGAQSNSRADGVRSPKRRSRRRRMSAARRKAVSVRMKKFWAERRKAKTAKK